MSELSEKHCKPCDGGTPPLSRERVDQLRREIDTAWQVVNDDKALKREYRFKKFHHTMGFVNAIAYIANTQEHHPDLEVGYNYCRVLLTTHAIGGLSENDFICAAKIDAL